MQSLCKKLGLRFYVSDSDFKELSCGGSCCGLTKDWNYQRAQFTEVLTYAKKKYEDFLQWNPGQFEKASCASTVTFDQFYGDIEPVFDFRWAHAQNFNTGGSKKRTKYYKMSMYDYIRYIWNSPFELNSPYKYFKGLLKPVKRDKSWNLVYVYNPTRIL
jgi:hypothetical protein